MHPNHGYGSPQPYQQPPVPYRPPGPHAPPQPPQPPRKPFRAGRLALILVGAFLGVIALAVAAALFAVEQLAGTGHEVAWRVDEHPGGEDGRTFSAFRAGDRLVHVGTTAVTSYALASGQATTVKRFDEDAEPCTAASRPVGELVVFSQAGRHPCGALVAIDHTTGREAWRTQLDLAPPADGAGTHGARGVWIAGDTVLGSSGHQLQAFDARDGAAGWTYRLKERCRIADLAADGSHVVLATFCGDNPRDHQLTQLDLATGKERWQVTYAEQTTDEYTTVVLATSPPALLTIDDDKTLGKSQLRVFDDRGDEKRTTGARADDSREEREDGTVDRYHVTGPTLVALTGTDKLVGFDLRTGERTWVTNLDEDARFATGMPDGEVAVVYDYLDPRYGTLDPEDGDLDRGKLLPDDPELDAEYLHTGELLLARNHSAAYDDVPWLLAYRPE